MGDFAKIALKTGLMAIILAGFVVLLVGIQFPSVSLTSDIITGIGKAKAFASYWLPNYGIILTLGLAIVAFDFSVMLFKFTIQAVKWIMKVNE